MIIFDRNVSRLAIRTAHRSTLSDETKKSGKKSRGRTAYDPPFSTLINFFSKTECSRIPNFFYEMIYDPSESNEHIFGTFRGPLISEVLFLIELSHSPWVVYPRPTLAES